MMPKIEAYQLFPLAMCFIYRYISGAHQAMHLEVRLFRFFSYIPKLGSQTTNPTKGWHETLRVIHIQVRMLDP